MPNIIVNRINDGNNDPQQKKATTKKDLLPKR